MTPKNYPQNHLTQNIFIFVKTPKIEIKIVEPPQMTPSYVCMKISETPPPLWSHDIEVTR